MRSITFCIVWLLSFVAATPWCNAKPDDADTVQSIKVSKPGVFIHGMFDLWSDQLLVGVKDGYLFNWYDDVALWQNKDIVIFQACLSVKEACVYVVAYETLTKSYFLERITSLNRPNSIEIVQRLVSPDITLKADDHAVYYSTFVNHEQKVFKVTDGKVDEVFHIKKFIFDFQPVNNKIYLNFGKSLMVYNELTHALKPVISTQKNIHSFFITATNKLFIRHGGELNYYGLITTAKAALSKFYCGAAKSFKIVDDLVFCSYPVSNRFVVYRWTY